MTPEQMRDINEEASKALTGLMDAGRSAAELYSKTADSPEAIIVSKAAHALIYAFRALSRLPTGSLENMIVSFAQAVYTQGVVVGQRLSTPAFIATEEPE